MGLEELSVRLEPNLRILSVREPRGSARHRTLFGSIAWSHDLLEPEEAMLLARLSAFVGGWTLEAAEAVCSDPSTPGMLGGRDIMDLLANLVDQSIVQFEESAVPTARYRLLESVRQFALQKLEEFGAIEASRVRDRHVEWWVEATKEHSRMLFRSEGPFHMPFFDAEYPNLLAALAWARRSAGSGLQGLRICIYSGTYWHYRGHFREGLSQTRECLSGAPPSPEYARALFNIAGF